MSIETIKFQIKKNNKKTTWHHQHKKKNTSNFYHERTYWSCCHPSWTWRQLAGSQRVEPLQLGPELPEFDDDIFTGHHPFFPTCRIYVYILFRTIIYIYNKIYIYIYIYRYRYIYIYIYIYYIYIYIYIYLYIHKVCIHMYIYIYTHCIHIYINLSSSTNMRRPTFRTTNKIPMAPDPTILKLFLIQISRVSITIVGILFEYIPILVKKLCIARLCSE